MAALGLWPQPLWCMGVVLLGHPAAHMVKDRGPCVATAGARGPALCLQALIGCTVDVRTLDGRLLSIPINDIVQ